MMIAFSVIHDSNTRGRHPEVRALLRASKEGVQLGNCGHPSRLAEDGEHRRMTKSPAARERRREIDRDLKTIRPRAA
jgi:hypothetical protein